MKFLLYVAVHSNYVTFLTPLILLNATWKVFLHELNQRYFTSAIDEIMERLQQRSNIKINYRKIPSGPEMHRQGENSKCF